MCRAPRSTVAGRERHGCTHHRRAASWASIGMSDPRVIPFPVAHTKVSGPGGPSLISPLRPHRTERVHPPVYATPDSPARGGDVTSRAGEKRGARAMGARGRASVGRAFGSVERGGAVNPGGRAVPFLSPHATIWFFAARDGGRGPARKPGPTFRQVAGAREADSASTPPTACLARFRKFSNEGRAGRSLHRAPSRSRRAFACQGPGLGAIRRRETAAGQVSLPASPATFVRHGTPVRRHRGGTGPCGQ
ncbi:hypothetical protein MYXA107069_33215 [Myxococcus xanthus]|nr:hypothetical protein MyxoNM_38545 [Myxococcus xanthus]SDX40531.1 hypothetical protein SAMN05444383_107336 [Myxococcus xanthus]